MFVPLVIQHRHAHLSRADFQTLFGEGEVMTPELDIAHKGQFVCAETVDIEGKTGVMECVRILGPERVQTQVELSTTDAFAIGIVAPTRQSGDLTGSGSCVLVGPVGIVRAKASVIVPARHLHVSDRLAKKLHLSHRDVVTLRHAEREEIVFSQVFVRVHPSYAFEFHLCADEAAHDWLQTGELFELC